MMLSLGSHITPLTGSDGTEGKGDFTMVCQTEGFILSPEDRFKSHILISCCIGLRVLTICFVQVIL